MRLAMLDWVGDPARPGTSGLSDIVWELGQAMAARGHDIVVLGPHLSDAVIPAARLRVVRFDRPDAWRRNVLGQLLTCLALGRAIARLPRPDAIYVPEYLAAAVVSVSNPTIPVVFTTPGNIFERIVNGNPYDWSTTQVYKMAAWLAARRAGRVVALSQHMRHWWRLTGAPPERMAVVPLGIDATLFYPRPSARDELAIPSDEQPIVYAGRFSIEKNVPTLVRAFARLTRRHPRARLYLLGGGPGEAALRQLARDLGADDAIEFLGWVPRTRVPLYLSAADAVVLPSTSEPLARVLLEALACGALVVASTAGGTPDIVRSGENGILVDATDVDGWVEALDRALTDDAWRARQRRSAPGAARRQYDWPTIAARLEAEVFEPTIAESRRRPRHGRAGAPACLAPLTSIRPRVYFVDYVLDRSRPGASGLSDIVWDMAAELARQGGDAHVFGTYDRSPYPASGVTLHHVPVPPGGYRNVLGRAGVILSIEREMRRSGHRGIIHAPEYLSTGILAAIQRRNPVVMTVPGSIHEKIASGTNPYDRTMTLALRVTARLSARHCARVIATSASMHRWWARAGTAADRLIELPLGVDTARFHRQPDARARLGWRSDREVLLTVGRINRENGIDTLIRGFSQVATELPTADLHIVGTGPEVGPLQALAARLGIESRVIWHGWIDTADLATYYSAADLFIFSALAAGLPRVVLEAMACGAPVLATAISGVIDHIEPGQNGYLTAAGSDQAMAAAIRGALADPIGRGRVGASAARYIEERLSWRWVMRETIDRVYRPVMRAAGMA